MNYRLIRSVKAKGRFVELWLLLFFLGAIVLFQFIYPTALARFASRVASPLWNGQRFLSERFHSAASYFISKQKLEEDAERFSAELQQARALLLDRELLLTENRLLKEQFSRATSERVRLIGAILATPPRSPYDTAIIDIGMKDGVRVGDRALSGSVILGLVSKAFARTSVVEFFSTAGKKTLVSILHEGTRVPVEAIGEGGGEFRVMLPKATPIMVGDPIVMPGLSPHLFAVVVAIEGSAVDSFQGIRFRNPVSIQLLSLLEIQREVVEETYEP